MSCLQTRQINFSEILLGNRASHVNTSPMQIIHNDKIKYKLTTASSCVGLE